ncbi:serine/threonine protein kinase [candidate division KSB1 bacterium]|nr:serine/threonine protein kinase [candidate division KSB1 bacterium]
MVKIEGYEIFAELQRGPWVTLFKAFEVQRQRTVLIKLLNDQQAPRVVQEQLLVESELSSRLVHANLRRVYASGKFSGRGYLILEYVEGPTLAELIPRRLPIEFCAWIAKEVAQALMAVHREGILHRDVKPRNIFVSWEGEVKLGDLGLAVDVDEVSISLAGTPAYLSPEIVLGQKISQSSDLFALGAVLYEMLTTAPPFADHTTSATLHRIANLEPTPVAKLRPEVPTELAGLCRMLLSKTPEARCRNAEAVVDILAQFEHTQQFKISAECLAKYLQAPESYQPISFIKSSSVLPQETAPALAQLNPPPKRNMRRALAFLAPAIFMVGLVLANLRNEKLQNTAPPKAENESVVAPLEQKKNTSAAPLASKTTTSSSAQNAVSIPGAKSEPMLHSKARNDAELLKTPSEEPEPSEPAIVPGPTVWLHSEPRAKVFVENRLLGVTPLRWTLPQREQVYELRFVSPVLPEIRTLVTSAIIESDTLRLNLWKEAAYLEVTVNPWGEIWLDGKPIDTTPLSAPLALTPGMHELAVRHPQLGTRSLRIVLSRGDTLRKAFDLFTP